ncbi:MAG: carboxypeptidase-like regulatory domain-containing protein [Planctomycetes bacterium]|nr:carboxypeptidase-like regulatory domain-containing protein [Planctomycetota bacterium]
MRCVGFSLGLLLLSGCAESDGRQPLTGRVTFQGQPLDLASIDFTRADPSDPTVHSGAIIQNGQFNIPRGSGVPPGRYRVVISAGAPPTAPAVQAAPGAEARKPAPGPNPFQARERIPTRYNEASELFIEVTRGGPNHFEFALTEK